MHYSENLATAADYLKKSIPYMVNNQLPANPINYALWYCYVSQRNPDLTLALDTFLAGNESMTPEQSEELYYQYIVNEHLEDHEKTIQGITELATSLLSNLNQSVAGSNAFNDELDSSIEQLKQTQSLNELTEIAETIIDATETIQSANKKFISDLETANNEINSLKGQLQQAENHAHIDELTKLSNRRAFDKRLLQLIENDELAEGVCLVLADLDHFKAFNDNYGHIIGDRVLERMGELLQGFCTDNVFGARYGGEEFAIIVSESTIEQSIEVADNLRKKLETVRVKVKNSDKVLNNISASFGVARYQRGEAIDTFIDRTDQALYRAKENGRNRVEAA